MHVVSKYCVKQGRNREIRIIFFRNCIPLNPPIISNWITAVRKRIWCSNLLNFQIEHIYVFMSNFKSVPTIRRPPGTEKVKNTPVQVGLSAIWRVASTSVIPWNIPTSEELGILLGLEDILNSRSLPQTSNLDLDLDLDLDCRQGPRQRPKLWSNCSTAVYVGKGHNRTQIIKSPVLVVVTCCESYYFAFIYFSEKFGKNGGYILSILAQNRVFCLVNSI